MSDCKKYKARETGNMTAVVKLVVKTYLEPRHYRQLHRILSLQWGGTHSLTAAVRLMEAHGVKITPEEEKLLSQLPEERMIDALVMRMPQQSREQFEHFFLQLSFIASTTTRLRAGLEGGNPETIDDALESAENVGVLPHLLKMAVAQAGQEVQSFGTAHNEWLDDTNAKMTPLMQSQALAMTTQKELAQANATLAYYQDTARENSRAVLLAFADGSTEALLVAVFGAWAEELRKYKSAEEITAGYKAQLERAAQSGALHKSERLRVVRSFLIRSAEGQDHELLTIAMMAFRSEVECGRTKRSVESQKLDVTGRLDKLQGSAMVKATKMLAKWAGHSDSALTTMAFNGWVAWAEERKRIKVQEQELAAIEKKTRDLNKSLRSRTMGLIAGVLEETESGILNSVLHGWHEAVGEGRKVRVIEEELRESQNVLTSFSSRSKASSNAFFTSAVELQDMTILAFCVITWKRETKVERMRRYGKEKNMRRKQELLGVKGLFRNFANELETSLKEGTPRVEALMKADKKLPRSTSTGPMAS